MAALMRDAARRIAVTPTTSDTTTTPLDTTTSSDNPTTSNTTTSSDTITSDTTSLDTISSDTTSLDTISSDPSPLSVVAAAPDTDPADVFAAFHRLRCVESPRRPILKPRSGDNPAPYDPVEQLPSRPSFRDQLHRDMKSYLQQYDTVDTFATTLKERRQGYPLYLSYLSRRYFRVYTSRVLLFIYFINFRR